MPTPIVTTPPSAPTAQSERYQILDVLRGFALLGVLIANLVELGGQDLMATADQLAALPSAKMDAQTNWLLDMFVFDKANTLFAVLFGAGFWIMMERLSARGAAFERSYLRRIAILTGLGFVHLLGWFAWDILHVYGLTAFLLFFSRTLPDRVMFWIAIPLLTLARPILEWALPHIGLLAASSDAAYTEAAILSRQAAAQSGDYLAWGSGMNAMNWQAWFFGGALITWMAYVLGRFYIGAWIARQGWIQTAEERLYTVQMWTVPTLVAGFTLQYIAMAGEAAPGTSWSEDAALNVEILKGSATPIIAAGYVCVLVLLFHSRSLKRLVQPFAPVGQMALTNYLLQSPFIILILTGIGPGLGLVGRAGSTAFTLYALGFFVLQVVFSHFWMKSFAYGPAEWAWRAATYRTWPKLRRSA